MPRLFPTDVPADTWASFAAHGFSEPVDGVVYRTEAPPCCGVPLGGVGTGCIDLDARGVVRAVLTARPRFPAGCATA